MTTAPEMDGRYASLGKIQWWDLPTIRRARVLVVGCGALGNEVLKNLALIGVGDIVLVDFDHIEISNLTRSLLFRAEDAGRPKAVVAAERVRALNPDVRTHAVVGTMPNALGAGTVRAMDVVFGCVDNVAARLAINEVCHAVGRPWIDGGLRVADGQVRAFVPGLCQGCYQCNRQSQDLKTVQQRFSCQAGMGDGAGSEPTTPMAAAIIGAMQVQEAVKILLGRKVRSGETFTYGADGLSLQAVANPRDPDCPAHRPAEPLATVPLSVHATVEDVLRAAAKHHGGEGVLCLPRQVVISISCTECGDRRAAAFPHDDLHSDHLACPACGGECTYSLAATASARGPLATATVASLGCPPRAILAVRLGRTLAYVELGGDPLIPER